jgi:hypothetical protein
MVACKGFSLPNIKRVEVGETQSKNIRVPAPDGGTEQTLEIAMGAGSLAVASGADDALVDGTIEYNIAEIEPEVWTSDGQVRIKQGKLDGIPSFDEGLVNKWDLRLGNTPMDLTLNVGAASADIELGGLVLTDLDVSQGASRFDLAFSEANQAEMGSFDVVAGASKMSLSGLANANAAQVTFKGGAGSYTLRFDGELRRDLEVTIEAGLGQMVIIVPDGVAAEVTFEGAATDVDAVHEWERTDSGFVLPGEGPTITFQIKMGVGGLELRNK